MNYILNINRNNSHFSKRFGWQFFAIFTLLILALLFASPANACHFSDNTVNYNPTTLSLGSVASGTAVCPDQDWFVLNVTDGVGLTLKVKRTSDNLLPNIRVYDQVVAEGAAPAGAVIGLAPDNIGSDSVQVSFIPTFTGQVTVTVSVYSAIPADSGDFSIAVLESGTYCNSPALPIPDNDPAGVFTTIVVTESAIITDMNLSLLGLHTFVGDLKFTLIHNNTGTSVTVIDQPRKPALGAGTSNNNFNVVLDDEGAGGAVENLGDGISFNPWPTSPPSYTPNNPLSAFDGEDIKGTWTLTVSDLAGGDTGILNDWCILATLDYPPVVLCQNATVAVFGDIGTITVADVDAGSYDDVGIQTITVSPSSFTCNNIGSNLVTLTVTDSVGQVSTCQAEVVASNNFGVCPETYTTCSGTLNLPIPDVNVVGLNSTINLTDTAIIRDLNISVLGTHTFVGDLKFTLTHVETGTSVVFINQPNSGSDNNNFNVSLDDEGTGGPIESNGSPGGTLTWPTSPPSFRPNNPLSAFDGENVAGTWTLNVADLAGADIGNLTSWCLEIMEDFPPAVTCTDISVDLTANGTVTLNPYSAPIRTSTTNDSPWFSLVLDKSTFTCADIGPNTVTLTITDSIGQTSNCSSTITVNDPFGVCYQPCTTVNLAILDNLPSGNSTFFNISQPGKILDLNIGVVGTHTFVGDLIFTLKHVDTGTTVIFIDRPRLPGLGSGTSNNDFNVILDDEGTGGPVENLGTNVTATPWPTSPPSYTPNNPLSAFDGENIQGNWELSVSDNAAGDTGTVTQVCLSTLLDPAPNAVCQNISVDLDSTGTATITGADVDGGSNDANGIPTLTVIPDTFTCANLGTNNVTLTVTDSIGNVSTCNAVVTVNDPLGACVGGCSGAVNLPIPDNNPAGVTSTINIPQTGLIADLNVSVLGTHTWVGDLQFTLTHVSTGTSVTFIDQPLKPAFLDGSGNNNFNVTIDDEGSGGLIENLGDVNDVNAWPISPPSYTPNNPFTVFDGEDMQGDWTLTVADFSLFDSGTLTSWCIQFITDLPPDANCKNNNLALDGTGNATLPAAMVDNGSFDFVGIQSLSVSPNTFTSTDLGPQNVTLTVTDTIGQIATCNAVVTVVDTFPPAAVCKNITVNLDATGSATVTGQDIDNGSNDIFGIQSLSASPNTFSCSNLGANNVTLTVTDTNGNISTCVSTVTVANPLGVCSIICANPNMAIPDDNLTGITSQLVTAQIGSIIDLDISILGTHTFVGDLKFILTHVDTGTSAIVIDKPSNGNSNNNFDVTLDDEGTGGAIETSDGGDTSAPWPTSPPSYTPNNPLSVFDGEAIAGTWQLTVVDNSAADTGTLNSWCLTFAFDLPPVALCQNVTATLDSSGNASITAAQVDNGSSDNNAIASMSVSPNTFTCAEIGPQIVTLTVTDAGGLTDTCNAVVTVQDITPPIPSCRNYQLNLDATGNGSITTSDVDNGSTDNCGLQSISVAPNTFDCTNLGANTVTLSMMDASGNTSSCNATVTVVDSTPPVALCNDITISLDAAGTAVITLAQIDAGSTEECTIVSQVLTPSTFNCADVGLNNVTLSVTDNSGNVGTCNSVVTITDSFNFCATAFHKADQNVNGSISLTELLRLIQFFNVGSFHCDGAGSDGYNPGIGDQTCATHNSDYNPQNWAISLTELLRLIQFFNVGAYHPCPGIGEDGFCPGP